MLSVKPRLLATAALVAAVFAALTVAADSGTPTGRIHLVGSVTEYHIVQLGSLDKEAWVFSLASQRAKGKKFGYAILACTYVSVRTSIRECVGTFALPTGKLQVAGSFLYPSLFELAVTGSTGEYVNAGGTLTARLLPKTRNTYWFDFTLK